MSHILSLWMDFNNFFMHLDVPNKIKDSPVSSEELGREAATAPGINLLSERHSQKAICTASLGLGLHNYLLARGRTAEIQVSHYMTMRIK